MRLKVRHETTYVYGRAARSAIQTLRMTPRAFDGQFVRRWRVEIDADARLDRSEDAFGNVTHTVFIEGPVETVTVKVEGEVDTRDTSGVIRGTVERQPVALYLRGTALTEASPAIAAFAREQAAAADGDHLAALHRINEAMRESFAFVPGETTAATTAAEAFRERRGVCQDFAHVFVACARSLGAPARYAGGYVLRTEDDGKEAGHAWAEAHITGLGWVGFDPAEGMCVTDRYVRVAVGPDYLLAAPVRGAQIGGEDERLGVRVEVRAGQAVRDE